MTSSTDNSSSDSNSGSNSGFNCDSSNEDWKARLSPEQYYVMREGGTEPAFTGAYYYNKEAGEYRCGCCHTPLFDSDQKYESGSGWPSFWAPMDEAGIAEITDRSHGMARVEVRCKNCDAHLGHVFEDGPKPTGLRYCINSLSLDFVPRENDK